MTLTNPMPLIVMDDLAGAVDELVVHSQCVATNSLVSVMKTAALLIEPRIERCSKVDTVRSLPIVR